MSERRHQTKPQASPLWIAKNPLPDSPDADAIVRAAQSSSGNITSCCHVLPNACGESLRALRRTFRYSGQSFKAIGWTDTTDTPSKWGLGSFILWQLLAASVSSTEVPIATLDANKKSASECFRGSERNGAMSQVRSFANDASTI